MSKPSTSSLMSNAVESTDGVRPAIQARSLRKRHDLLNAGLVLMRARPLDEISIKEICAAAHCTVGSFYSRFEDKNSYFDALLARGCENALESAEQLFNDPLWGRQSGLQVVEAIVGFVLQMFRDEFGPVITEAFLKECKGEKFSTPVDEVGKRFGRAIFDVLAPHVDVNVHQDPAHAIQFALQSLYACLVNAALRRTIVPFDSPEFDIQIKKMFSAYLGIR